jgi:hypothetical protein
MRYFDIGAYRGWALSIAKRTSSEVVTFDLEPRSIEIVISFVSASPGLPIIAKKAMFGNGGATIDEMSKEFFYPDFIKMDIE